MFSQNGATSTCTYSGAGTDTFTVPSGVSSLDVVAIGAAGGYGEGGLGASVEDTAVSVSSGDSLGVTVGGAGGAGYCCGGGGAGGTPGGGGPGGDYPVGSGSYGGAGGGGYSGLFDPSMNPLVIAGGGGGEGAYGGPGGNGDTGSGGGNGADGDSCCTHPLPGSGGHGATTGGVGAGGIDDSDGTGPGSPGSGMSGGQGGAGNGDSSWGSGGGGGGGYFGGGGGGGAWDAGSGGGGSSFGVGPGLSNGSNSTAAASVTISWAGAGSVSLHASAPGSGTAGGAIPASSIGAFLSGGNAPTGTVTFRVFGPQSTPPTLCGSGGTLVGTPVGVSGNGNYHPNAGFTPTAAGDYWWFASYSGDSNNSAAGSFCGGAMPETIVGPSGSANTSPPKISGSPQLGQTLTESHAGWSATPTGFTYEWFDCSASGSSCKAIGGATRASYKLTSSDVGHTVRVVETARFANGATSSATSAATAVVSGASAPLGPSITNSIVSKKHHKAKFVFGSSGGNGFECAVVKRHKHKKPHYKSCSSPKLYTNLKPGKYTFKVKALGVSGGPASTPTTQSFTI